jgi:hypothetical protein
MELEGSLPYSPNPILSQMNPVHTIPSSFFNIHCNIAILIRASENAGRRANDKQYEF